MCFFKYAITVSVNSVNDSHSDSKQLMKNTRQAGPDLPHFVTGKRYLFI